MTRSSFSPETDSSSTPPASTDVGNNASNQVFIRRVGNNASNQLSIRRVVEPNPRIKPPSTALPRQPRPPLPQDVADACQKLTDTTPWLVNWSGPALERTYLFPTPASAFAFVDEVEQALSPSRRMPPHWAGCGRRVYVRFNSPHSDGSPGPDGSLQQSRHKAVSMLDVECALACDRLAQEAAARAGGVIEAINWSEHMKSSKQRNIDSLSPVYPVGSWKEKTQRVSSARERFWGLVRDQGWTPEASNEDFWPAWAVAKYGACISTTRWKLTDDGSMGRLSISEKSLEDIANRALGLVERSLVWQRQSQNTHGTQLSRTLWRVTYDALGQPSE
ncbi:MIT domain-containing protein [Lasiodiplodia theobromae]|uniref:MIT domain-containing protein n=1 Tax=Lasiodiplodia theobromae TaxID=45133 RepID=UPI0015C378E6|nr:MIT domain-containing protein [Lasiodiplodia theobromae]KAF4543532.1 MIT domain-containing protein [Lasiodiplodia theobromae]